MDGDHLAVPGFPGECRQRAPQGLGNRRHSGRRFFTFLAPSAPANVLGMAHNTGRAGRELPPQAFHKAATSVVGPGDAIELRARAWATSTRKRN